MLLKAAVVWAGRTLMLHTDPAPDFPGKLHPRLLKSRIYTPSGRQRLRGGSGTLLSTEVLLQKLARVWGILRYLRGWWVCPAEVLQVEMLLLQHHLQGDH